MELILVDSITKKFQKDFWSTPFCALEGVSFSINEGEVIGFLGANGAGKTTTLKILFDFIKADQGQVHFSQKLGGSLNRALKHIGYLPERPYFYPHLTGEEFVLYMASLNDISKARAKELMAKWAKRFKIDHALGRMIRGYSKGMLQRIGFVSALVHEPKILILDEPLSGLDPVGRKEFKDVLRELKGEGKTLFFSSHIVSDIEEVCNKVVVLENGKLMYEGLIDTLIDVNANPQYEIKLGKVKEGFALEGLECLDKDRSIYQINGPKNDVLRKLLEQGVEIDFLTPFRPSLEEIIYKIRS